MTAAFLAALSHNHPSARLLAIYGDYAWNVLGDRELGLRMTGAAIETAPDEPAYRITQVRMLIALDHTDEAQEASRKLETLNIGGRLDTSIRSLQNQISEKRATATSSSQGAHVR